MVLPALQVTKMSPTNLTYKYVFHEEEKKIHTPFFLGKLVKTKSK